MINEHLNRNVPEEWRDGGGCSFCRIISKELSSNILYETDEVVAILDILPLRPGHTLVLPKVHIPYVTDLPANVAAAMGVAVSKVAKAVSEAMQNTALNIVCNQEYAQSVPHVCALWFFWFRLTDDRSGSLSHYTCTGVWRVTTGRCDASDAEDEAGVAPAGVRGAE